MTINNSMGGASAAMRAWFPELAGGAVRQQAARAVHRPAARPAARQDVFRLIPIVSKHSGVVLAVTRRKLRGGCPPGGSPAAINQQIDAGIWRAVPVNGSEFVLRWA